MIAYPAPFWLFDARLGWVEPPILPATGDEQQTGWQVTIQENPTFTILEMRTHSQYLDIQDAHRLPLAHVSTNKGLVLSGKIPHWLITAVTRQQVFHHPWTAVYQPPLQAAIVVYSRDSSDIHLGKRISLA
jgi:CRISPR-associated protein Csx3